MKAAWGFQLMPAAAVAMPAPAAAVATPAMIAPGSTYIDRRPTTLSSLGRWIGRHGREWRPREVVWVATGRLIHDEAAADEPRMHKCGFAAKIAEKTGLKHSDCLKAFTSLAEVLAKEVGKTGKVVLAGCAC